jgi:hypothetical protein
MDHPHLMEAITTVSSQLGGLTRVWRFDRIARYSSPGGNRYSVPPELAAATVTVAHRLHDSHIDIRTGTTVIARRRVAEPGLGLTVRDSGHVIALNMLTMAATPPGKPHRRKQGTHSRRT